MKALVAILTAVVLTGFLSQSSLTQIRLDVALQTIVATVRDKSGRMMKGLDAKDFIVEEDGVRQTVSFVSDDPDVPISVGFLIDNSSSMAAMPGGTVSGVSAATGIARMFLHILKPTDEVQLMAFDNRVSVKQKFTDRFADVDTALTRLRANGMMSVLEAVVPALQEMKTAKNRKRAMVVMTDAYFNGDLNKVRSTIRNAEVPLYTFAMRGVSIGLEYPGGHSCSDACHPFGTLPHAPRPLSVGLGGPQIMGAAPDLTASFLNTLAEESGGRSTVLEVHKPDAIVRINATLEDIAADLRGQYIVGYYPTKPRPENPVIRVRMANPDFQVRMRREVMGVSVSR